MHTNKLIFILVAVLSLAIVFTACEGPMGPQGPQGEIGEEGEQGPAGQDGQDGEDAKYTSYLNIGPFTSEFTMSFTRGFYFQAPVNFVIYDLQVPEHIDGDVQNIAVVRFDDEPVFWPSGNNSEFEVLYYETNLPSDEKAIVNIEVSAGDHIGILGARGTSTMHHAYGPDAVYQSSIKGVSVDLYRLAMQSNLNSNAPTVLLVEVNAPISQIHLRYF